MLDGILYIGIVENNGVHKNLLGVSQKRERVL